VDSTLVALKKGSAETARRCDEELTHARNIEQGRRKGEWRKMIDMTCGPQLSLRERFFMSPILFGK
jgi:hypothetical protein